MVLPLLDYGDIVWGDKHNKTLMAKFQLLQGKAAKLILDKAKHSSATEAINELDWLVLSERRRQHRLSFVFKCMHGLIDWNFNLRTRWKHTITTLGTKTTFVCPNLGASGGNED